MAKKVYKKEKIKKLHHAKRFVKTYWLLLLPCLLLLGAFYYFILRDLPSPRGLSQSTLSRSTEIYDRHNTLLYTVYSERNQRFVPLSEIPMTVQLATIAVEDRNFYHHGAVDLRGIARALYATTFKKQLQGGSTLTQQLVKNSLLTQDRTIQRKLKEVILAFATEMLYSKEKILEMYLNQVPYGGTAYGIEVASRTYFGKSVKHVTLSEATLLAGLPESPTSFSPYGARPELAKARQRQVLQAMVEEKYISEKQRQAASSEQLVYQKITNPIKAPHFVLYVKELLSKKYGETLVEQGGLKVHTSLDLKIQDFAQQTVASEVATLKNYKVKNGASLVTNPATGEILAMVGSTDYFNTENDGNVNVTLATRQPGSSIKPINYAVGLIKGYSAATVFVDQPVCFPGNPRYCPRNYDGKFHGVVNMRQALGSSLNIPAVQMLKLNTVEAMIATASAMGITSYKDPSKYGLSLTLGGGEVTMLEMATAFGVFANQGYRVNLHPILKVTDANGKILEEYKKPPSPIFGTRVLPPGVAFIINQILQDNNARLMAFGANSELKIGKELVSVKTGTTNDYKDNWTIGYTPTILVATWVGNNDNTPMGSIVSGVTGAAPIWNTIMEEQLKTNRPEWPKQPKQVIGKYVCSTSGLNPPADGTPDRCPTRYEYFIKGSEPKKLDSARQKVFIDKTTNDFAKPGQTENVEERMEVITTDPLGNRYCLTCPRPSPSPSTTP